MAAPLGLGVLGAGAVALDYFAVLKQIDELTVTGVVDPDAEARSRARDATGAAVFATAAELLAQTDCDAALVLTPPATHEPLVLELLGAGLHVLCEKPLALTATGAQRMVQHAARTGRLLMMASKFRYVPDILEAQRMVAEGAVGDVALLDNSFCSRVDMVSRWNSDAAVSGGGVLIDNGCHSVDIARCFLGPLTRVMAHFGRRTQAIGVEDTVRVLVESVRGAVGLIDLSWSLDKGNDYYLGLMGTAGTIQVGWRGSRYRAAGDREWTAFGSGYDKRAAFAGQLRNFAAAIAGLERPVITSADALESVRAVEAAYRAARVGRWVPLPLHEGVY